MYFVIIDLNLLQLLHNNCVKKRDKKKYLHENHVCVQKKYKIEVGTERVPVSLTKQQKIHCML